MIRINLFPVRQARLTEIGKLHAVIGLAGLLFVVSVIVVLYRYQVKENDRLRAKNDKIRKELEALKKGLGDYEKVKAQRAELQRQQEAIKKLQKDRAGPVFLMRELSDILSKGKGPSFDKAEYED